MKSNQIPYLLSLLFVGTIMQSCKKQINLDPPVTQLVTTNVFNDNGTATAAQLAIYAQINSVPYYLHAATGLSSDEFYTYATDQASKDTYANSLAISDATSTNLNYWNFLYGYIYQVNAVLEGLQQSTKLAPKVKKQLTGEAEFMRAYFYFYLVNIYGDVPLAITTDYRKTSNLLRTPKAEVYQQIVQDLTAAQNDLSTKFVDATDTTSTIDRIRPSIWAAEALLSRTYLYMGAGYYDKAEAQATSVINNSNLFTLLPDLNTVFKKNSNEAIWQIPDYSNGSSPFFTQDGQNFVLTGPPSTGSINNSTISTQLLSAFEVGDQRKAKWIGTYTSGANSWNYPAKYKDNSLTATSTSEYTMMLRLAEQYLIRAEARAQQGNTNGAIADLNTIRNRAGLGNYIGATDQSSLIIAISHERQVELFAEADRWFNLKRTGTVDAIMGVVTAQKGGTWNSYQQLYPIPSTEISRDINLKQTPGY